MIGITRYRSFIPIGLRTFILRKFFAIKKWDLTQVLIMRCIYNSADFALLVKARFPVKQAFLLDLSTRPTCRNALPNYSGDLFLVLLMRFHCKSYGALTSIHPVT